KKFIGNFKDIFSDKQQEARFYDMFFRVIGQLVNQVAARKDVPMFKIVADFAGQFTSRLQLEDSFGLWILAAAVNTAAEHLNRPEQIVLTGPDGKKTIPKLGIES